jgi:hypothetical protein
LDGVEGALFSSVAVAETKSHENGYWAASRDDGGVYPYVNDADWEKHESTGTESSYNGEDRPEVGVKIDGALEKEPADSLVLLKLES